MTAPHVHVNDAQVGEHSPDLPRRIEAAVLAENAGDNANEWGNGWCVVVDSPVTCGNATVAQLLQEFAATDPNTFSGEGALNTVARLSFNSRGVLAGAAGGSLDLCGDAGSNGRRVSIAATGRAMSENLVCP